MNSTLTRRRGFTLMELLISMTIIAIMVTIIAGALRLGIRAWEKGEANMEAYQRQRAVLNLMAHQMTTIMASDRGAYTTNPMALQGHSDMLAYVSRRPILLKGRESLIIARYEVVTAEDDSLQLHYSETPYVAAQNPEAVFETENKTKERVLFQGFHSIGFEFLGWTEKEGSDESISSTMLDMPELSWQAAWDPDVETHYPRAVRITIVSNSTNAPIKVIVAIYSG